MSYNILDAAKDLVTGHLEFVTEEQEKKRLAICEPCDANMLGVCTCCGCVIKAKAKLLKGECPMGLWDLGESDSTTIND